MTEAKLDLEKFCELVADALDSRPSTLVGVKLRKELDAALGELLTELKARRAQAVSGWVSVKERMPAAGLPLWFVTHREPNTVRTGRVNADDFVANGSLFCWRHAEVAYWMPAEPPLPAPPAAEKAP